MNSQTTRSISKLAHSASTLIFALAFAFFFSAVRERVPRGLTVGIALFLAVGASVLLAAYVWLFALGVLDQPLPLGRFVADAWGSILASTVMVAVSWIPLSGVVDPTSNRLLFVVPVLMVVATGLTIHRVYCLRLRRSPGGTQPDPQIPRL